MPDSYAYLPEVFAGSSTSDQNGFGSAKVVKVDVSPSHIAYRTCGGTNEDNVGNVSATTIQRDLKFALDWLYNKKNIRISSNYDGGTTFTSSFTSLNGNEPKQRLEATDTSPSVTNKGLGSTNPRETIFESGFALETFEIGSGCRSILTRMYNGSVDDEDNFIGYGVSGFTDAISDMTFISGANVLGSVHGFYGKATGRIAVMRVCNYANISGFVASGSAFKRTVFNSVNIDGCNFICLASGSSHNIGDPPPVVNISISGAGGFFGISVNDGLGGSHPINIVGTSDWF